MDWSLSKSQDGVPDGNFGSQGPCQDSSSKYMMSLLTGRVAKDYPLGELPKRANTFINDFLGSRASTPQIILHFRMCLLY